MTGTRNAVLLIATFGVVLATASSLATFAQEDAPSQPASFRVQQLRKQRVKILEQAFEELQTAHREGIVPLKALLDMQLELTQAQVEAARTKFQRQAALKQQLKVAGRIEQLVLEQYKGGLVKHLDVLMAKAARLKVEIAVEEMKSKNASTPKN